MTYEKNVYFSRDKETILRLDSQKSSRTKEWFKKNQNPSSIN